MSETEKKKKWRDIGEDLTEEDEAAMDRAWAYVDSLERTPEQKKHDEEWDKNLGIIPIPKKLW